MRMYTRASPITLSGVPDASRMTRAVKSPIAMRTTPRMEPKVRMVCIIRLIFSLFFCPMRFARAAFGPTERPTIRFTKMPTSATQLPTAASALSPANLPTTATSAELKSCCRILLQARGMAKSISFPPRPPFSISISFTFMSYFNLFFSRLVSITCRNAATG